MTETCYDSGYERLLEDFGQSLQEAETRGAGGLHRRRRVASVGFVLAGITAGVLLLTGVGGGGGVDVVAQAEAALAPLRPVVHLVTPGVAERWSATQPTRWRVAATVPSVTAQGTHPEQVQRSYGGSTEEIYLQSLNTLEITTGIGGDGLQGSSSGPLGTDPVARIRSMLEAGQLHDTGSGTVGGRVVSRLVGEELSPPSGAPHAPWPVEYDVEPNTYAPVRFTVEEVGTNFPGNAGTPSEVVEVNTYEQLPLNEATAALLSIHPTGSPTVVHH